MPTPMPSYKPTLFALFTLVACRPNPSDTADGSTGESSSGDGPSTTVDPSAGPTTGGLTSGGGTTTDPDATDPEPTGTDSSNDGGEDTKVDAVCEGQCVPAPEGWNGPVARYEVSARGEDAGCGGGVFDTEAARFEDGQVVDDTTCDCECGEMTGASCSEPVLRRTTSSAECDYVFISSSPIVNLVYGCNDTSFTSPPPPSGLAFELGATTMSGGQCDPIATTTLPEPAPGVELVVCETAPGFEFDTAGCAPDALCVPEHDGPTCVWAQGEQECPDGFGAPRVVFSGFDDTRGCSECECGDAVGTCEGGGVALFPNFDNCTFGFNPTIYLDPLECAEPSVVSSISLVEADPVGGCAPSAVVPTGELASLNPTTVCCTE